MRVPPLQDRRRKKTRDEFQHELFLRKRSRKNIRAVRMESIDLAALAEEEEDEESDSDFGSGEEGFFVSDPKKKAAKKTGMETK